MSKSDPSNATEETLPWWRFGHVWLVIAGPALVVVAGIWTLYLAMSRADELVTNRGSQTPVIIDDQGRTFQASGQAPAMKARNHAQTPVVPAR